MEEYEYGAMYRVEATHWWFVSRRKFVSVLFRSMGLFGKSGKKYRIADIGAGTGGMIPFLSQYGAVTGVEPNRKGRSFAKKRGIRLVNGSAEKTGLPKNSMDMACFFDVLYHEGLDDGRALREASRILKPGGILVITDCALPYLSGPHDRAVQGRERYILSALSGKVQRAGFIPLKKTYTFFFLFPLVCIKRLVDRYIILSSLMHSDVRPAPWVFQVLCVAVNSVEAMLLPFMSYPWGSSLIIIARKKGAAR
ncbi:class I SAM-dependent methyltransferase [Candidatus Gottesmanbacteria bacterium]|nr:class I SAM-dependent methyltransferase [Candidatus Gottesmanbacteria bacterium]